ncbi:hypothetical protein AcV7_004825 [Taiwanofungus camphoratus]|nr:hypothetical protein AcV7_004825 [Antrodia cinnamomea]
MASLSSATQAAHPAATFVFSSAQAIPGQRSPPPSSSRRTTLSRPSPSQASPVGVPGAFIDMCSTQIPSYIKAYDQFKNKGVEDIYVVTVNDVCVTKVWKEQLAPGGTPVRFIADDKGVFVGALGMLFDASAFLGGPHSKELSNPPTDHSKTLLQPTTGGIGSYNIPNTPSPS